MENKMFNKVNTEKIIKILKKGQRCTAACKDCIQYGNCSICPTAEYLSDNNAYISPCRIGQEIWVIHKGEIKKATIYGFTIDPEYPVRIRVRIEYIMDDYTGMIGTFDDIMILNHDAFFTKKEAEDKIKKYIKGEN